MCVNMLAIFILVVFVFAERRIQFRSHLRTRNCLMVSLMTQKQDHLCANTRYLNGKEDINFHSNLLNIYLFSNHSATISINNSTFRVTRLLLKPQVLQNVLYLIFVYIISKLCFAEFIEGHDHKSYENVDKEEREDHKVNDVKDCHVSAKPWDGTFVRICCRHGRL